MITAKFKVDNIEPYGDQTRIIMTPDYNDERNKEWSKWTPTGNITLFVKNEVARHFPTGHNFLVTFTDED